MKKNSNLVNLGNGVYFDGMEIHEKLDENSNVKEWMTWEEGWSWVISSLKKIEETNHGNLLS